MCPLAVSVDTVNKCKLNICKLCCAVREFQTGTYTSHQRLLVGSIASFTSSKVFFWVACELSFLLKIFKGMFVGKYNIRRIVLGIILQIGGANLKYNIQVVG